MRLFILLLAVSACAADPFNGRLVVSWTNLAGIPGGIPVRGTIFTNMTVGASSAEINAAIAACPSNQVVFLPEGAYQLTNSLSIRKDGVTLRGAGAGKTVLTITRAASHVQMYPQNNWFWYARYITNQAHSGSTNFTVAVSNLNIFPNLKDGTIMVLYMTNDPPFVSRFGADGGCGWCGTDFTSTTTNVMTEVHLCVGKGLSNVLTARPLMWGYTNNAGGNEAGGVMSFSEGTLRLCGLEDMTLAYPTNYGSASTVWINSAAYCWVKGVEIYQSAKIGIQLATPCYGCEVRQCYVRDPWVTSSGSGYGVWLFGPNSYHLIEDNLFQSNRHALAFEGGGSGCVLGYNFSYRIYTQESTNWLSTDLTTHGAHPYFNLYEGNVVHRWSEDYTWGTASHNTAFRNHFMGRGPVSRYTLGVASASIDKGNWFMNAVGNVLGWPGETNLSWFSDHNENAIWRFGYSSDGDSTSDDTNSLASAWLHCNIDVKIGTNAVVAGADTTLPSSLYLSAKPSWFSNAVWPSIGPDVSGYTNMIPAQMRYLGIDYSGTNSPPADPPARPGRRAAVGRVGTIRAR